MPPRHPTHFLKIHFIIILPTMPEFSKWAPPLRLNHQHSVCTSPLPKRATCSVHLILFDFINRIIFGENYRSFSSSLCIFLYPPAASSLLGPNILLSTLFSKVPSVHSSPNMSDHVSQPYRIIDNYTLKYYTPFLCIKYLSDYTN